MRHSLSIVCKGREDSIHAVREEANNQAEDELPGRTRGDKDREPDEQHLVLNQKRLIIFYLCCMKKQKAKRSKYWSNLQQKNLLKANFALNGRMDNHG